MFSGDYWSGFLDWLRVSVLAAGAISEEDFDLLRVFDSPVDVANAVKTWYLEREVIGRKALQK